MLRAVASTLLFTTIASAQAPDFPTPKTFPPDAETLKKVRVKRNELDEKIEEIEKKGLLKLPLNSLEDVFIYREAATKLLDFKEWYSQKTAADVLAILETGLLRADALLEFRTPWREPSTKAINLGFRSRVDWSVQPYSIRFPVDFDPKKKYRLDVILHGRDDTLTEAKFLAAKEASKPNPNLDHFELEVYGRGSLAYRWVAETDIVETIASISRVLAGKGESPFDPSRIVLRGFSMGGAGTWHLGLHDPFSYAVLGPGAGFTTTKGYIAKFPEQPEYIEKCLKIYDAVEYAENAFNVSIVAYSGEKDNQKAAADNIEKALKDFKEPLKFQHIVAPGLGHQQPPEWQKKLEEEYRKQLKVGRPDFQDHVRYVTSTPKYNGGNWAHVFALEKQYEKSILDAKKTGDTVVVTTVNARILRLNLLGKKVKVLTVDNQSFEDLKTDQFVLRKQDNKWSILTKPEDITHIFKMSNLQGPIDDAFTSEFGISTSPEKPGWTVETTKFIGERRFEFLTNWERFLRGRMPALAKSDEDKPETSAKNWILFGDPASNPLIAKVLPKLPITWTKEELVVNGKKYDSKTHVPVLIYPNPLCPSKYVVLNSGHTFREADFRGTNALLYPRLGDWAVLKPKSTKDDPAGFEVVDAGLFDEDWQFAKKK